jgi:broad specificity phosphatase PhoE
VSGYGNSGDLDGEGDGPRLWIVRHGPTEWSTQGKHTGSTDIPLTAEGEREAVALRDRLAGVGFGLVLTSPLQRARRTAELAGFPDAELAPRAVEWDYGDYEGRTRAEIRQEVPGWSPWTHPQMPHGENLADVAARARAVADRVRGAGVPDVLLFAHGHLLRMVAVSWIEAPWDLAWRLPLEPAHLSVMGWDRGTAVVDRWNA